MKVNVGVLKTVFLSLDPKSKQQHYLPVSGEVVITITRNFERKKIIQSEAE